MAIELVKKESEFNSRKEFLVALACAFLKENTGYSGIEDTLNYDEASCDGYCLASDLESEFGLEETEYTTGNKEAK